MPISPLELQTLFTQMDKVGREQSAAKEGTALQQSIQGAMTVKKNEESARTVKSTETTKDNTRGIGIKEDYDQEEDAAGGKPEGEKGPPEEEESGEEAQTIRDPSLGRRVDLSG